MKRNKTRGNICADLDMDELFRRQSLAADPELAQLIGDSFGQAFFAQWQQRRQEIGQGYAALLCRVLQSGPAQIRAGFPERPGI